MRTPLLPLVTLLAACSGPQGYPTQVPDLSRPGSGPGDGPPPPGAPGAPGERGPGGPGPEGMAQEGPCTPTAYAQERRPIDDGEGVRIEGRIHYAGSRSGELLVDVLTVPGAMPATPIYHLICGAPGALEAVLPEDLGRVMLVAYLDTDRSGPDERDPAGLLEGGPVEVGTTDLRGLSITIHDNPELGDFSVTSGISSGPPSDGPEADANPAPATPSDAPDAGMPTMLPSHSADPTAPVGS